MTAGRSQLLSEFSSLYVLLDDCQGIVGHREGDFDFRYHLSRFFPYVTNVLFHTIFPARIPAALAVCTPPPIMDYIPEGWSTAAAAASDTPDWTKTAKAKPDIIPKRVNNKNKPVDCLFISSTF